MMGQQAVHRFPPRLRLLDLESFFLRRRGSGATGQGCCFCFRHAAVFPCWALAWSWGLRLGFRDSRSAVGTRPPVVGCSLVAVSFLRVVVTSYFLAQAVPLLCYSPSPSRPASTWNGFRCSMYHASSTI